MMGHTLCFSRLRTFDYINTFFVGKVRGKGRPCIKNCVGLPDGDYQSCTGCDVYASCVGGIIIDKRPCVIDLIWDDNKKYCDSPPSSTCPCKFIISDFPPSSTCPCKFIIGDSPPSSKCPCKFILYDYPLSKVTYIT